MIKQIMTWFYMHEKKPDLNKRIIIKNFYGNFFVGVLKEDGFIYVVDAYNLPHIRDVIAWAYI